MNRNDSDIIITGNVSDNYFSIELADYLQQPYSLSDIVSLKVFANSEFCPRFIWDDETDYSITGRSLENKTVVIVSVDNDWFSRNELAMRNMILARTAKDNSAKEVILVEPDLFYSAQDRGPKPEHGKTDFKRTKEDLHKFNGQAFTGKLYAQLLHEAGVDVVYTVHNHSFSIEHECKTIFGENNFINLFPDEIFLDFIQHNLLLNDKEMVLVAPDEGATQFIKDVASLKKPEIPYILLDKTRKSEHHVNTRLSDNSPTPLEYIENKNVFVLDDMVRTGSTIVESCKLLTKFNPAKIYFLVTHFYSSQAIRQNLSIPYLNEIITTNTLPSILNRDNQGRLRKKMAVLKITKWIAHSLSQRLHLNKINKPWYVEDISDKNPRINKY